MVHFRQPKLFRITANSTSSELYVTCVPAVFIAEHTHEGGLAARMKCLDYRRIRRIKPTVAISHEKFGSQTIEGVANRAARAEQRCPVDDVIDLHAEPPA